MTTPKESVFTDIANCEICEGHKPFHFEMGGQKIMLVSFAPSYAALHRPLYFMLLFRKMCLALFGDVAPSERFIKEFYDPAGNIYWTHYHKCFKREAMGAVPACLPFLVREIEVLDPEIIILLGPETISRLPPDRHPYIAARKDGSARQVFRTDFPSEETAEQYEEIRKAIKPFINWVRVECGDLDFSGANFMDLEYASIVSLNEYEKTAAVKINGFERAWVDGIILPNIQAYNLILQVFIFIESNIKNLLESRLDPHDDFEKRWFVPFEELVIRKLHGRGQRQAAYSLMADIDSLRALRNAIAHKSGVVSDQAGKTIAKLKRLKGVYVYAGNSIFISREGVDHILGICDSFRRVFSANFI